MLKTLVSLILTLSVSSAYAFEDRSRELVGQWDQVGKGEEIIIKRDGRVFSNGDNSLSGSAGSCITDGANFCFSGKFDGAGYTCSYAVAFLRGGDSVDFRVTRDSWRYCPRGIFSRSG